MTDLVPLVRQALTAADDNGQYLFEVRTDRYTKVIPDCDSGKGKYGFRPDLAITNRRNGKPIFLDACSHGFERIFKYTAPIAVANIKRTLGLNYNPFFFLFYGQLSFQASYISKFAWYLEPERYFLWAGFPELRNLTKFLRGILTYTR